MQPQERLHRTLRALLTHYPMRFGAAWLNRRLDRFFDRPDPRWLLAPGRGKWPTMVLNVATNLQRKLYYFPKVYGRFYGNTAFAEFLARTLQPGGGFVDIGSNVGFFALRAAELVGAEGNVWAFEPEPDIHEALVRSAEANGLSHLRAFNLALSDRDETLEFFRARDGTASSLVPEAPGKEARYERTLTVRVTTLDKLVAEGLLDPARISAIKVDVEGEEVRTVRGMLATLEAAYCPPIWAEVRGPQGSTRAPNTYIGVKETLAPLGYVPHRWTAAGPQRITDDAEVVMRTDVLFQRA